MWAWENSLCHHLLQNHGTSAKHIWAVTSCITTLKDDIVSMQLPLRCHGWLMIMICWDMRQYGPQHGSTTASLAQWSVGRDALLSSADELSRRKRSMSRNCLVGLPLTPKADYLAQIDELQTLEMARRSRHFVLSECLAEYKTDWQEIWSIQHAKATQLLRKLITRAPQGK